MARLILFLVILCSWAAPASAAALDRWSLEIEEASSRFGIPEDWIRRVMQAESGGRLTLNGRPIVSPRGAMGLMQLMPGTWSDVRARLGLGRDPHDPRDNILAGTFYLRALYNQFGYPGLFAAYNAGPGRYLEHLAIGRRLPAETLAYAAKVSGRSPATGRADRLDSALFAKPTRSEPNSAFEVIGAAGANSLFVPLTESPAH